MKGDYDVHEPLLNLLDAHLKATYLVKDTVSTRLGVDVEIADYGKKLGDATMTMAKVLGDLKISYVSVLRCYASTVQIIAGNNIFADFGPLIRFPGINLGLVAAKNIVLPKNVTIDTSGQPIRCSDGQESNVFKHPQAFGHKEEAGKGKPGQNGEDGFDGFCGTNAGNLMMSAGECIVNLEEIALIRCQGGNGSNGQKGGIGQNGGKGQDTGDAVAEPIGSRWLDPSFSIAFARFPGYDPATKEFTKLAEISGSGGHAGKAGFGGEKGHGGQIIIKDNGGQRYLHNKPDNVQSYEFSDSLAVLAPKIQTGHGEPGMEASTNGVLGGQAGEPGVCGMDHAFCQSQFFAGEDKNGKKADYSNYLDLIPDTKFGVELNFKEERKDKYIDNDITKNPRAFAKNSTQFTVVKAGFFAVAAAATAAVLFLAGPFSWWMVPAAASTLYSGYKLARDFSYEIGVKRGRENTNQAQVIFKNRYADLEPVRSDWECRANPRQSQKSRGQSGNSSRCKSQQERQSHSKSVPVSVNVFATDAASLNAKAKQLQNDTAKKESNDSLVKQHNIILSETATVMATCANVNADLETKSAELARLTSVLDAKQNEKAELDEKITVIARGHRKSNDPDGRAREVALGQYQRLLGKHEPTAASTCEDGIRSD